MTTSVNEGTIKVFYFDSYSYLNKGMVTVDLAEKMCQLNLLFLMTKVFTNESYKYFEPRGYSTTFSSVEALKIFEDKINNMFDFEGMYDAVNNCKPEEIQKNGKSCLVDLTCRIKPHGDIEYIIVPSKD